jgi:Ser/Thr protein kinase RdoA (MazF antagonist)
LGYSLGSISKSLVNFKHDAFHRTHAWDLKNFESTYKNFNPFIEEEDVRCLLDKVFERFSKDVIPNAHLFHKSVIMGDCNDANVILNSSNEVEGIIDFGDAVYTWSINEIAIAMAYALLTEYGRLNPIECLSCLFGGFRMSSQGRVDNQIRNPENSVLDSEFNQEELAALHTLIAVRLSTSIAIGAYSISKEPDNEYLKLHSHPAKEALKMLFSSTDITTDSSILNTSMHTKHSTGEVLLNLFSRINKTAINFSVNEMTDNYLTALLIGMAKL